MLDRREVLKLAAFSVLASAGGSAIAKGGANTMKSRPLMTVRIEAGEAQKFGKVPHGVRTMVPVTGGDFEGPRLRGKILPGGGDWLLLRSDGVMEFDLRITLQTDDGALIYMTFVGLRHGDDPSSYFRTTPRFESAAAKYDFLNRLICISVSQKLPTGAVHEIEEIL